METHICVVFLVKLFRDRWDMEFNRRETAALSLLHTQTD